MAPRKHANMAKASQVTPPSATPPPPTTPSIVSKLPEVPDIQDNDSFGELARKLSFYFVEAVNTPLTFDKLRKTPHIESLQPLIDWLSTDAHHPAIVAALLALRGHFAAAEAIDNRGVNLARGYACEVVAWQFVVNLSEREVIDFLLYELPPRAKDVDDPRHPRHDPEAQNGKDTKTAGKTKSVGKPTAGPSIGPSAGKLNGNTDESTPLLSRDRDQPGSLDVSEPAVHFADDHDGSTYFGTDHVLHENEMTDAEQFEHQFESLNALEIAAVSSAKKFLMQQIVQDVINGIWHGNIVFWESLSVRSVKVPKVYNKHKTDPYCRLRVPRYIKTFEVVFFTVFLALYYAVLIERPVHYINATEIALYVFIASFTYDELSEFYDAGELFYITDFWSWWDLAIIAIGVSFFVLRIVGVTRESDHLIKIAFDILSLEAIFLVPRIFSMLSLHPYFGTLIPCLKEMAKQFAKFMSIVVLAYFGFLTTMTLLARGNLQLKDVAWVSMKVFFGAGVVGFDAANDISPYLGLPVMLVFVCMTNILLITTMASFIGNSLTKVLDSSREEYLFVYSIYVLEASTSDRLTYFFPPLNLLPLVLLRPLGLVMSAEKLRAARILLLKVTHAPYVAVIWLYENGGQYMASAPSLRGSLKSSKGTGAAETPGKQSGAKPRSFKSSLKAPRTALFGRSGKWPGLGRKNKGSTAGASEVLALRAQVAQLQAQVAERQGQK